MAVETYAFYFCTCPDRHHLNFLNSEAAKIPKRRKRRKPRFKATVQIGSSVNGWRPHQCLRMPGLCCAKPEFPKMSWIRRLWLRIPTKALTPQFLKSRTNNIAEQ